MSDKDSDTSEQQQEADLSSVRVARIEFKLVEQPLGIVEREVCFCAVGCCNEV